jgi:hypothetical protein
MPEIARQHPDVNAWLTVSPRSQASEVRPSNDYRHAALVRIEEVIGDGKHADKRWPS